MITFGVDFFRNFLLQSNVEKPPWHWHRDLYPTVPVWTSALVTTDPRGGLAGTLSGLGGSQRERAQSHLLGPAHNLM